MVSPLHWLYILTVVFGLLRLQPALAQAPGLQPPASSLQPNSLPLARFYTPPQMPGESNHYIDMWGGPPLRELAMYAGLTNNHALLVNSHGKTIQTPAGQSYIYYPHSKVVNASLSCPYFSAADLAAVLGPAAAGQIHNIAVSGCNRENAFSAVELRKYFPNATNIVHAPAGQAGYQPMFFQALFNLSTEIRPLYENARRNERGELEYNLDYTPVSPSTMLSPYIAELFDPGGVQPYRIQIAGRELLALP